MSATDSRTRNAGSTEALLAALVAGHTIIDAAKAAGMSEATAHRRLKRPEVLAKLDELRHATLTTAADRLASLATASVVVLGRIANDATVSPGVRVRACEVLLSKALQVRDVALIEQRLAAVEHSNAMREAAQKAWVA